MNDFPTPRHGRIDRITAWVAFSFRQHGYIDRIEQWVYLNSMIDMSGAKERARSVSHVWYRQEVYDVASDHVN